MEVVLMPDRAARFWVDGTARRLVGDPAGGVHRLVAVHRVCDMGRLPGRALHLRSLPLSLLLARAVR